MDILPLFPTNIFKKKCNLELESIRKMCYDHCLDNPSVTISNIGGYQGQNFHSSELTEEIVSSLPRSNNKVLTEIGIYQWLNINKFGNSNSTHNHNPFDGIALSGVFYVSAPPDSGSIVFYDPKNLITTSLDQIYYNNGNDCFLIEPEENLLLIFPSWLYHSVDPNHSNEDRISISFNIRLTYTDADF